MDREPQSREFTNRDYEQMEKDMGISKEIEAFKARNSVRFRPPSKGGIEK